VIITANGMILGLIRCSRGTHALLMRYVSPSQAASANVASFTFEWPRFSNEFHSEAKSLLDAALNKGNKPPIIADRIQVVELEMGTQVSPFNSPRSSPTLCSPPNSRSATLES
jgi:hypothetical protein